MVSGDDEGNLKVLAEEADVLLLSRGRRLVTQKGRHEGRVPHLALLDRIEGQIVQAWLGPTVEGIPDTQHVRHALGSLHDGDCGPHGGGGDFQNTLG